ncbi:siderophore ABC transporter substrate-binding protein [Janibacter cremeus]|uniref:Iron complex transport system substrate-binding protein n=1 Tax=Janibacter cremeus TaxID=1285192 RepID=A0A852VSM2_9MICO|nr:ABC transporter substrate-binding protein [Janibacter cremeus]NYF98430.1 iron complex transport system substrate-binding protein [Janibacter cremeus]
MTRTRSIALIGGFALALSACGGASSGDTGASEGPTTEVEDNNGTQTVPADPASVVATDNRTFETLADWDVELSAAAVSLMPETNDYTSDDSIVDLGIHREPDLEAVVAVEPDLIINGQRYADHHDKLAELVPDATILELDPREGQPFDEELKRQTSVLGEVFDEQDSAQQINDDFDAAIERATGAYDSGETVMGLNTSGGEFGYVAPGNGRVIGPMFDVLGLEPALEVEDGSDDHQGDDISVEAIAKADPDWILVMDRDAAISSDDEDYTPAKDLIENSEALQDVTAVKEGNVLYMPADTYLNEGIQTYTDFFDTFADALEGKS